MRTSKINNQTHTDIKQGTLLCSTPLNPDPDNFKTLVLVTRHSYLGSSGVILNSPLGIRIQVSDLNSGKKSLELNYGGHEDDGLSFLVCLPSFHNGWKDSIYWSKSIRDLKMLIQYISTENMSIYAYNGSMKWLPGELNEQVRNHYWWTTEDYSVNEITNNSLNTWSAITKKTGGHFAPLVNFDHPIIFN